MEKTPTPTPTAQQEEAEAAKKRALRLRLYVLAVAMVVYALDTFSLTFMLASFGSARGFACCTLCRARDWTDAKVEPSAIQLVNGTLCSLPPSASGFSSLAGSCAPVVPPPGCGPFLCTPDRLNEAYGAAKGTGFSLAALRLALVVVAAVAAVVTTFWVPKRKRNRRILRLVMLALLVVSVILAIVLFVVKAGYADVKCKDAYDGDEHSLCNRDTGLACPGLKILAVFTNPSVFTLPAIISIIAACLSFLVFAVRIVYRKKLRHSVESSSHAAALQAKGEDALLAPDLDELEHCEDETSLDAVAVALVPSPPPAETVPGGVVPSGVCCVAASMPPGWERSVHVNDQGIPVFFYSNHVTATTSWDPPETSIVLPPGVEEKFCGDGKPYYVDHRSGETRWNPEA